MPESSKWIFHNASRRPVELHLADGVVVLLPWETLAVSEPEPHCLALVQQGVLTQHEVRQEEEEKEPEKAAPDPVETPASEQLSETNEGDSA